MALLNSPLRYTMTARHWSPPALDATCRERARTRSRARAAWREAETLVTAEFHRTEIERSFAPKKLEITIDRFELNPGKSNIVRFLNEHAG